jgi:hypothetical protein
LKEREKGDGELKEHHLGRGRRERKRKCKGEL